MGTHNNPKYKKIKIKNYNIKKRQLEPTSQDKIEIVIVVFTNVQTSKDIEFELGGNQITEGMAYLAERYVYATILDEQGHHINEVHDYPYSIVHKLAKMIYPELAEDILKVIAVCDICLMTYHLGLNFIRLLEYFKKNNVLSSTLSGKDGVDILYNEAKKKLQGECLDFTQLANQVCNEIRTWFKGHHQTFDSIDKWVDHIFHIVKVLRTGSPSFIIDLIDMGNLKENIIFKTVYELLGSPLALNADNNATMMIPTDLKPSFEASQITYFWAKNQMLRIFTNNKPIPCELLEFCKKNAKIQVDDRCQQEPWSRCNDEQGCPLGIIWKACGLCDCSPNFP
jgi:hypothetical protein